MKVYLANNWNKEYLALVKSDKDLGLVFTPTDYQRKGDYAHFLDNDAFGAWRHKQPFNSGNFMKSLDREIGKPDFVVLPDIVAGGLKSLEFSEKWLDFLEYLGYRFNFYIAVQDGMNKQSIPERLYPRIGGLFVGGTMDWKLATAEKWTQLAKEKNLKIHVARIGILKRVMFCARIGADSCDSSNFVRHTANMRHLLEWKKGVHQPLEAVLSA